MAGRRGNSSANALHLILRDSNLLEYEPLLLEEGADDVSQLKELDEEEFRQLCLMVGMASKPFHVKRLQKALGRPSSQIYSQKRLGPVTNDFSRPPAPLENTPGGAARSLPIVHTPQVMPAPPPVSQLPTQISSPSPTLPSNPPPPPPAQDHYQQHMLQQYQQQKQPQQREKMATGYRMGTFSPEKDSPANSDADSLTYQPPTQTSTATATDSSSSSSRQLFLPHYLQPDSDCKDLSALVDELTPIQAELGPCPFKPTDWDERRSELVRRYAAIYGQGNSKRKHEELSLHEENINVAAFQLCLRDPTLLVRRDELLVLSRKAIKDGGYTFQHGLSKAKISTETATMSSVGNPHKRPFETMAGLDNASSSFMAGDIAGSLLPLPRNMSREKKLKRVEELEFLITKNKMKQSIKLTALEKARQANDFSMSHHLQAEIESLGNTLANLQEEYSNMKYRLRRSDRYFEKKHKKLEDELDDRLLHGHNSGVTAIEVVPKRIRSVPHLEPSDQQALTGPSNSFYQPTTSSQHGVCRTGSLSERQLTSPQAMISPSQGDANAHCGLHDSTSLSVVQTYSIVTTAAASSSPLSHPPPPTPPSHTTSPPALLHTSETASPPPSSSYLTNRPTVMAQVLPQQEEDEDSNTPTTHKQKDQAGSDNLAEDDLPSHQLLDNINKLATQAAANLRSLPHF